MRHSLIALILIVGCAGADVKPTNDTKPKQDAPRSTKYDDDVSDLVGKPAPGWQLDRWYNSPPLTLDDLRGKVVLVRWFMDPSCPFCSGTAPSLKLFDESYRDDGLVVVGMYHHKGSEPLEKTDVEAYVKHYGFRFPIAVDADWKTVKRWWLDGHNRGWTSVSFLIDRAGIVRHIHLGGKYEPGSPDFDVMKSKIEELIAEPAPTAAR